MKTYIKLTEAGTPEVLTRIPNVINPTDEMAAEYAKANGFKELITLEQPNEFYISKYVESDTEITLTWEPMDLDTAKEEAKTLVQNKLDNMLQTRTVIACEDIEAGIIYDNNALTNAMGLEEGDMFIDAADGVHTVTAEDIRNIKASLKAHRLSLYSEATQLRIRIGNAEDVDTLAEVIS